MRECEGKKEREVVKATFLCVISLAVAALVTLLDRTPKSSAVLLLQYKIPDEQEEQDMEQEHPLIDYTPPHLINRLISDIGVLPPGAILDEMLSLYH